MPWLVLLWKLASFLLTRAIPALFRVVAAVAVWCFSFLDAHHAAILAFLSWVASAASGVGSGVYSAAHWAFAYFATSAVTGIWHELEMGFQSPADRVKQIATDEWDRLKVALASRFPPPNPPAAA